MYIPNKNDGKFQNIHQEFQEELLQNFILGRRRQAC